MGKAAISVIVLLVLACTLLSAPPADSDLDRRFAQTVRPFLASYCIGCHSGSSPAAQFDLKAYSSLSDVVREYPRWNVVLEKLEAGQMPPKPMKQPPADERRAVIDWVKAVRAEEARRNAGDPGPVLARRLSNSEYDYTIRDLTGVDMRPAREFPVDPANTAGFDNSGESLSMTPALLKKYLQAAHDVADHMVLTPDGFNFAPYPMLVETDREKYPIERIVDFYRRQPTDFADYFHAAWRFKYRKELGDPTDTLASAAAANHVSPQYLPLVWNLIEEPPAVVQQEVGPIARLQSMWRALPVPPADDAAVRAQCGAMRDFVVRIRKDTGMQFAAPLVAGLPAGSQPLLDWKNRQFAGHRRDFDPTSLRNDTDPPLPLLEIPKYPGLHREASYRWAVVIQHSRAKDPNLVVPAAERRRYAASFTRFANVFPDGFYVKERGRYFPDDSQDKGRLLSAGYHNTMGYFRDDTALMELILDEQGRAELNRLWDEFDYIADYTAHTWVQYYFNQSGEVEGKGAEAGSPRPVGREITDTSVIMEMRDRYVAKAAANPNNDPVAGQAIREHFQHVDDTLRRLERMRKDAEPHHLDALLGFAARAWRRPLTGSEREALLAFYHSLRDSSGLTHEDAVRDSIVRVLMSPNFTYRVDLVEASAAAKPAKAVPTTGVPLNACALASRLSYFLWSSMPDDELLAHAASGDLQNPEVLVAQARRMLKDDRARALAIEFGGNWLDFRRFEEINTVDRDRFPSFTNELREAMFQEPVRFLDDVIRNGRSVLDLVYGDYTFVNPVLAKHYGMPEVAGPADHWVRIDNAGVYGRGGILPMSAFLTQNAPGLRTSPVKRGYWVVRRVLGEVIPPPPPTVPELPNDEAKMDLPLRQILEKHRSNAVCASCHARFDSFGLAFEGYGPVGEHRTKDLAGHAIDAHAVFPDGTQGDGLAGLKTYISAHRQDDFLDNLSLKLLAYGLGRSLQLSDDPLIEQMNARIAADGYRFAPLVEAIVTSPQFRNKRRPNSE
jgi:mono/diheme cytochrome c family protein